MHIVNICICTYMREQMLSDCLQSLVAVNVPDKVTVTVSVIDNDASGSSEGCVSRAAEALPFTVRYMQETKRGIPCARNRAIEESIQHGADFIVFIDDDEIVTADWLVNLYNYNVQKGGRAVVHGKVSQRLPDNLPPSIQGLYKGGKRFSGEALSACATDNVLIPIHLVTELELRFDESNPLAGGTDTIFFTQATSKGVEIFQCNEALVYETIPKQRATLKWLAKRKYRAGITDAWRKSQRGRSKTSIVMSASFHVVSSALKMLMMALLMRGLARNQSFLKMCRYAGVFMGVFGARVDSYRHLN
ncbi:glycosyltransferase family 2 protein [Neptunomonas phycophila]|uniref:glycosyltransferase family 2 protein n=1 Tax=Neptunomonas phycophila TaxID=1572645 RepID=UPI003513317D